MKGFIAKIVAGSCFGAGVIVVTGCTHYRDVVDPCWFERYNSIAKHSVSELENAQSAQGHILDQTVWNWHFEIDSKGDPTAILNGAGIETLKLISRRQPMPDFQIYLQTAQDLKYQAGDAPEKFNVVRMKLDEGRKLAIHRLLATQSPLHGGGTYSITVHDFVPPGNPAYWTDEAQKNFLKNITAGKLQDFALPKVQ